MLLEEKYKRNDIRNSIRTKDWAAGPSTKEKQEMMIYNGVGMTKETLTFPPSLYKIIDEPIVNVLDHLVRNPRDVTKMEITIDDNGRISIYNDGPGIEIAIHKGVNLYIPQYIFGETFQGSNTEKQSDSIVGGTNGIGTKVANCLSTEFTVETVSEGRKYFQRWSGGMTNVEPPIITMAPSTKPYTIISFVPEYFGIYGYKTIDEILPTVLKLGKTRALLAAMYASTISKVFRVVFNSEVINSTTPADLAKLTFPEADVFEIVSRQDKYIWNYVIAVGAGRGSITNINGVVTTGGSHIKYIKNTLVAPHVVKYISKVFKDKATKTSTTTIGNNIYIIGNMQVPCPGWTGQRKDVMIKDEALLSEHKIQPKVLDEIAEAVMNAIYKKTRSTRKKREKITDNDKYTSALKAGTKYSSACSLLLAEGDSAITQIRIGLSSHKNLGFDFYGILSTGGVIINARRNVKMIGGRLQPNDKLKNNIFMSTLVNVIGLDWGASYDPKSPTYKTEMAKLRYGQIVACVDQDLDGVGNIFGLILNNFEVLWPNLLRAGFVKRFATPIIRAYPTSARDKKVINFYTDPEYRKWAALNDESKYEIRYYKGLGTHSREETVNMFKYFNERIYTYSTTPASSPIFVSYYTKECADERKEILSIPIEPPSESLIAEQESTRLVRCEDHLQYETKLYQLDNVDRHLFHIIDGHNQSGRKIYDGVLKAFGASNKRMKVAQLAGFIAEHENYHHGEASLADSVRGKAATFLGAEQIPYLIPLSNFGTRMHGGKDASPPRYIYTKFNKRVWDLICPADDYQLLEFNFDEGERGEPKYFIPIIPTVMCANYSTTGHAWSINLWARDVVDVINNVKKLIKCGSGSIAYVDAMLPSVHGFKGSIVMMDGVYASLGDFIRTGPNTITIVELPLRVWTAAYYISTLKKIMDANPGIIVDASNLSNDVEVNIVVEFAPGYLQTKDDDDIIELLKLRNKMHTNINLTMPDGTIGTFDTYEQIFPIWFPIRKQQYEKRIAHKRMLLEIRIIVQREKLRYVTNDVFGGRANKMKVVELVEILERNNYKRVNKTNLGALKFVPTGELMNHVFGKGANYSYLIDDISDRMRSSDGIDKIESELNKYEAELEQLNKMASGGRFPGAIIWLEELEALEKVILEGRATNWLYGEAAKYEYD